jgi:2-polyprenyl-6-methoxyphenol hydroxylase-like FAD-dependent oxidoreductase
MRILVAGAGIAGLSLARALEQRGIEAQLVERQPNQPDVGAGLFLPGNAVRAIELLGLSKEVAAKAVHIKRQLILNARGKVLNSVETESLWRDCGPCLSLPHKDLRDILEVSLRRSTVSYRRSIAGLTQDSAGCVVTFDDGMAAQYDLVVGTDGIHSKLRNMVSLGGPARYTGNVCWRFITKNIAGIGCWTAMLGNGRTLLAIPISPTHVYVYADLAVSTDNVQSLSQTTPLGPLFKDFAGPVFPLIESLAPDTYIHYSSLQEVRLKDWVKGRAVLLGDAAHGCSPNMAEGAGMAMEDALVLAEELARHSGIGKAFRAYVERRKPRTGWVQKQCRVRDTMRALPASPRAAILRLFGTLLYRRSYAPLLNPF